MMDGDRPFDGVIFTPDDEPYLGLPALKNLDDVISMFLEDQEIIAAHTKDNDPTRLQLAAAQLVPSASSIALSARELIRQGYLMSAMILQRPLFERAATLSYLIENPADLHLWEDGWTHSTRPPLRRRIAAMHRRPPSLAADADWSPPDKQQLDAVLEDMNGLVHGDPASAMHGVIQLGGSAAFTVAKDVDSPERATTIAIFASMMLIVLHARCRQIFQHR